MPPLLALVAAVLAVAQIALPRRVAYIPYLVAIFHVGNAPIVSEFTTLRLVMLLGLVRAMASGHFVWSRHCKTDVIVVIFSIFAMLSSFAHTASLHNPFIERIGLILNVLGSYLYARAYLTRDVMVGSFAAHLAVVLIPLAALMALEQRTGRNPYFSLGARSAVAGMRNDKVRAQGPFGHSIIAGTAGATSLPFMIFLWRQRRRAIGTAGIGAALTITLASASSGPLAALLAALGLLGFWRFRSHLRNAKFAALGMLIALHFAMTQPVWFLIAKIDLVGGSTGRHRSMLIDASIHYLHEWWLAGTDYTRHWMFSGVSWNPNHTDITNYYLQFGVLGGLPLMFSFILMLVFALSMLERGMKVLRAAGDLDEFMLWCVWTSILTHCVSFISIAYFDQSYGLIFGLLGLAPTLAAAPMAGHFAQPRRELRAA